MELDISIVYSEYDNCTTSIKKAGTRSKNNSSNYKTEISKTDMPCAVSYKTTIETIKEVLDLYNSMVEEDLTKLVAIRDNLKTADSQK